MGSGQWYRWDSRPTVEESLVFDIASLRGRLVDGYVGSAGWRWHGGKASISYRVSGTEDRMVVMLNYRCNGQDVTIQVRLQTSPVHFGGFRWWFTCPLICNDVPCRRRVAKLYSSPRSPYFGCRKCMGLTYESCRDSQTKARLWGEIRRSRQIG